MPGDALPGARREAASSHPKNERDYIETLVHRVVGAPGLNLFVEALAPSLIVAWICSR